VWDWRDDRRQFVAACLGHIAKKCGEHPRLVDTLPDKFLKKWREIEQRGGKPKLGKRAGQPNEWGNWCVKDDGPAEEIPTMNGPAEAASESSVAPGDEATRASKYPRLEFVTLDILTGIAPRDFLLGKQYQRAATSGTMAPGGRGKSSLVHVEGVSMAIQRLLVSSEPARRLRVWYHNGEENFEEMRRRLDAICIYYGISAADLADWFCMTTAEKFPLRVAEVGSGERFTPDANLLTHMYQEIQRNKFDVVIVDPLIALHGVPESNPVMMRGVMDIFRDLAVSASCSVEIVGHTRKPAMGATDAQLTAYDTRGSGAIVDALRSVRMLDLMTAEEARAAGIEDHARERYVKVTPAKRNYSATAVMPDWVKIENLIISSGDDVGVVAPWEWPDSDPAALEANVLRAQQVFLEAARRLIEIDKVRLSDRAGKNYAPTILAATDEAKEARVGKDALEEAMKRLIRTGWLEVFDGRIKWTPGSRTQGCKAHPMITTINATHIIQTLYTYICVWGHTASPSGPALHAQCGYP
jgi:hypothetical protein